MNKGINILYSGWLGDFCLTPNKWVSEWLLFSANAAIFQLYHGENRLIFNGMMHRFALYKTNTLSCIFIVLTHWNNSPWIDMSPHSDTLSWFRSNQYLFFLHNAACLAAKQQIAIWMSLVWSDRDSNPRFSRGEYSNHYTIDTVTPSNKCSAIWWEQFAFRWFYYDVRVQLDFYSARSLKKSACRYVILLENITLSILALTRWEIPGESTNAILIVFVLTYIARI